MSVKAKDKVVKTEPLDETVSVSDHFFSGKYTTNLVFDKHIFTFTRV